MWVRKTLRMVCMWVWVSLRVSAVMDNCPVHGILHLSPNDTWDDILGELQRLCCVYPVRLDLPCQCCVQSCEISWKSSGCSSARTFKKRPNTSSVPSLLKAEYTHSGWPLHTHSYTFSFCSISFCETIVTTLHTALYIVFTWDRGPSDSAHIHCREKKTNQFVTLKQGISSCSRNLWHGWKRTNYCANEPFCSCTTHVHFRCHCGRSWN